MNRLAVILAIVALSVCTATTVHGDPISLSESWYIKITNFSLLERGFSEQFMYSWSTTSLIEPKVQDPYGGYNRTLLFDFHAGQVTTNDYVRLEPLATCGSVWGGTMSFDWEIYCSHPRVRLRVSGDDKEWWTATGISGSASFYVSTWGWGAFPPGFVVSFASVPEPTSFSTLLFPISLSGIRFAFRRSRR